MCRWNKVALLCVVLLPGWGFAQAVDENERLDKFLSRLGLIDLQTAHLERVLSEQREEAPRLQLAQRLADVYAGQLLTYSGDHEKFEQVLRRIHALLANVPAAKTASLDVMLLQADYYRAESSVGKWLADRSETTSRTEAETILYRIAPELTRLQKDLNARHDKLLEEVDKLGDQEPREAQEQELLRLQAIAGRAAYFAAWSNYYLGFLKNSPTDFAAALQLFRQILGVGEDYKDVDAEYLGLESIWRARSLIGLALTEAAVSNAAHSDHYFGLLAHPSTPPELRDQADYWRLQSLLNTRRYPEAAELARQQLAAFTGTATQGQVSFCVSLVQAAYASETPDEPARRSLGTLGLGGLIKLGQRQTAKQLMSKYHVALDAQAGFYLRWLQGQQLFEQAEQTKQPADYQLAVTELTQALQDPGARDDLGATGQCRNQLAWCYYRLGNFPAAGRDFQLAAEHLLAAKDKQAIDAAWMGFVAYQAASTDAPRFKETAIDLLNLIKREFPQHEYAKRADYYIGKLRQSGSPTETLHSLESVATDAPDYLAARYEIVILRYQQWSKAPSAEREGLATPLFTAADTYLNIARGDSDKGRGAKVGVLAADVALAAVPPATSQAATYLERARTFVSELEDSHPSVADFHFRALQLAQQQGDGTGEQQHANWIVEHAAGSRYEMPAVIALAREVDKGLQSAGDQATTAELQAAFRLYQRLVALLGDSVEVIRANKNAQVANSKLADYAARLGQHELAAQHLDSLLAASPDPPNKSYVRRAGLAHYAAGNYAESIGSWRTLVRGLTKGSDEWFEAKYYQLACLFQTDRAAAEVALAQFKLLYPDLGPVAWRDKFAALQ